MTYTITLFDLPYYIADCYAPFSKEIEVDIDDLSKQLTLLGLEAKEQKKDHAKDKK